jgi:threonine aldolase
MYFASDNWSGVTNAVMAAIARHNDGFAAAYGDDAVTKAVTQRFCELFETEVEVHFVASGTAANAMSMAAVARPGGLVFCTEESHVNGSELGATEFFTGGMKLLPVAAEAGLMIPEALATMLQRFPPAGRSGRPVALTLTQATESGTVYQLNHLRALTGMARAADLTIHMDGARFGNGVAAIGASPAEITWKSGVDLLSFGGTKNGCLGAEAVVVFSPGKFPDLPALRQRAGHVISKARFVAAQFEGYLADGNWLSTARHANAMSTLLREGISRSNAARLGWDSQANEVFAILPKTTIERLRENDAMLYEWEIDGVAEGNRPAADEDMVRLVTSWATSVEEVERFLSLL